MFKLQTTVVFSDDAIYKALASVDKDNLSSKELLLICHRCRQLSIAKAASLVFELVSSNQGLAAKQLRLSME